MNACRRTFRMDDTPAWMPKYSTDAAKEDDEDVVETTEATAEADGTAYRPWEGDQEERPAGRPFEPKPTDAFAAPPGMHETPAAKKDPALVRWRRTRLAAMMLLWTGGFLALGGILTILLGAMGASIAELEWEFHGDRGAYRDAEEIRSVTALIGWPLLVVATPFIIAGTGLLYQRSWARPLGITMGVLGLLLVPIGTLLNGIALGMFGGGAGEDT